MKILKTMVLAGVMAAVCGTMAQADTTDELLITGEVAPISSIAFSVDHELAVNLNSAITNVVIGTLQIDNNDPEGFTITLTSQNSGKLIRHNGTDTYYSGDVQGNVIAYTLQFVPNASPGILGATAAAGFESMNLTLAGGAGTDYVFDTAVQATVARLYNVQMSRDAAPHLFKSDQVNDVYQDLLTVDIANL